jgi:hypothetical protein
MFKRKEKKQQESSTATAGATPALDTSSSHATDPSPPISTITAEDPNDGKAPKEGFFERVKRKTANAGHATKLQAYKTKKQAQNQVLRKQLADRKKQFGIDFLDLHLANATPQHKNACLQEALEEIQEIQEQIDQNVEKMESKQEIYRNEKITADPNRPEQAVDSNNTGEAPKKLWQPRKKTANNPTGIYYPEPLKEDPYEKAYEQEMWGGEAPKSPRQQTQAAPRGYAPGRAGRAGRGPPPGRGRGRGPPQVPYVAGRGRGMPPPQGVRRGSAGSSPGRGTPPPGRGTYPAGPPLSPGGRGTRRVSGEGSQTEPPSSTSSDKSNTTAKKNKLGILDCKAPAEFANIKYEESQWTLAEIKFGGATAYTTVGVQEKVEGKSIPEALAYFKANPTKYAALFYQGSMVDWPIEQHQYTLVHREGTEGFIAKNPTPAGWMTMWKYDYHRLPPLKDNILPKKHRDEYTDKMTYGGQKLHSKKNPPILPGRGMGVGDTPLLKIIGDVDPSDIHQGQVGDCWLLSSISAIAEFDGAIKRLYRKTKKLDKMPFSDKKNIYTITLWDLTKWEEVDIEVDERLCASPDGRLLASKPSEDGELWVCYIEKAIAIHCGGWDKITGGTCGHAWGTYQHRHSLEKMRVERQCTR